MHNLDIRVARVSNPFGASQSPAKLQGAASIFARQVVSGETVTIWGNGSVVRDYIDVADVAHALIAIMKMQPSKDAVVPTYNVGSGEGLSLNELLQIIGDAANNTPKVSYIKARSFDIPANVLDISRLKSETEWAPKTELEPSIRRMVLCLQQSAS